jgi:hypothetical protein
MFSTVSSEWAEVLSCRMMAFYRLPFPNRGTNMIFACRMCVSLYIYPHLMVTFTSTCHMLSKLYTPFPTLPHFWPKNNSCHNLWNDFHIYTLLAELFSALSLPWFRCLSQQCTSTVLAGCTFYHVITSMIEKLVLVVHRFCLGAEEIWM